MYGEIMIGINLVFNLAVLLFANAAGQMHIPKNRLFFSALLGALPPVIWKDSLLASFVSLLLMTGYAFGFTRRRLTGALGIVLIGAFLAGGLLSAIPINTWGQGTKFRIALYAVLAFVVLKFVKEKWLSVRQLRRLSDLLCQSTLYLFGSAIPLRAFIDTGNNCTEPMSNDAVHFVSFKAIKSLLPDTFIECLLQTANTSDGIPDLSIFPTDYQKRLRLIRIQTVEESSWAVGLRFDKWVLENNRNLDPGYIVFTQEDTRFPHQASAILHVSTLEMNEERRIAHAT